MKKKVLLSVVSLMAMFGMASCGGNSDSVAPSSQTPTSDSSAPTSEAPTSEAVTLTSLSINNKTDFTGLHAGDANVKLDLAIAPVGNITSLVNSGVITITSSNTAVGIVNGLYFSPIAAGETTITVTSGSLSDTVTVTVEESLAAPEYVKDKTLHEVWTMDNDAGAHAYVVTGTIKSMKSGSEAYGSFYLSSDDETDGDIYVYGSNAKASAMVYNLADKAYKFTNPKDFNADAATKDIKAGDKVTMLAIRADYNTTKELVGIILAVDDKPVSNGAMTTDEVQAVENDKTFAYTVTGKITKWTSGTDGGQYGNFSIKTEGATGDELIVYGASGTKAALAFTNGVNAFTNPKDFLTNDVTKDLKVGDEISMLAIRCDYNDTKEIQGIVLSDADVPAATEVADLADMTEVGTTYLAKGVVAATNTKGFVLSDGTHAAYVHMNDVPTVAIGDYVSVEAPLSTYNGQIQMNGEIGTVTKLTEGTAPVAPAAIELTKEIADGFATKTYAVADTALYKWTSTIGMNGNFFTMPFAGSETLIEPAYLDSAKFTLEEGKNFDLEGYFIGYNTNHNYAVFMVTKAEIKAENATAITITGAQAEVAQGGQMRLGVSLTPTSATDEVEWSSSYDKVTVVDGLVTVAADAVVGTEVTITAASKVNAEVKGTCTFTVSEAVAGTTVEKTVAELATANGWVDATQYPSATLDSVITVTYAGGGNDGKYYASSGGSWRSYASANGTVTISAAEGYSISTVEMTLTKGAYKDANNATVTFPYTVAASSVTFTCTSNANVTSFKVVYVSTSAE